MPLLGTVSCWFSPTAFAGLGLVTAKDAVLYMPFWACCFLKKAIMCAVFEDPGTLIYSIRPDRASGFLINSLRQPACLWNLHV